MSRNSPKTRHPHRALGHHAPSHRTLGHRVAARMRGVSLIELMIALVLGLIVTGSALTLFMTNRQTFTATENLGRVQENARVAFELMASDVRQAAGNTCGSALDDTVNVLDTTSPGYDWYANFAGGVLGYNGAVTSTAFPFGTAEGTRVAGTDAVELKSAYSSGINVEEHQPTSAQFKVNTTAHDLQDNDVVMVCDATHAAIFQITNASPGTNDTIVHNAGTGSIGNCTKGLGAPLLCTAIGTAYEFGCAFGGVGLPAGTDCDTPSNKWLATIAKVKASRWFIGNNGRGGNSLYRASLSNNAGVLSAVPDEIADGVDDMQLEYLELGESDYGPATSVGDWTRVGAVKINLTLHGEDQIDGEQLERTLQHVVTIRNRVP